MSERIAIENVKPGMVIIKVTAQNGPVKIKKSGLVNSVDMVKALAEMGVQEVEIDPDITVEIPKKKIPKSKTQELLDSPGHATLAMDNSISDQFNRSLFLPSVQELPEAWQYYSKKAAVLILVVLGGLSLGYSAANVKGWLSQPATVSMPSPQPTTSTASLPQQTAQQAPDIAQPKPSETGQEPSSNSQPNEAQQQKPSSDERLAQVNQPLEAEIEPAPAPEPQKQPEVSISPELLKRFENAVAAIDERPVEDPADTLAPQSDVTPVQELPAWILTQLPSMSFSAHMYASAPEERWVRVNGRRVLEGQEVEQGVRLVGIEPQHVILAYKGQEFSMEALSEW